MTTKIEDLVFKPCYDNEDDWALEANTDLADYSIFFDSETKKYWSFAYHNYIAILYSVGEHDTLEEAKSALNEYHKKETLEFYQMRGRNKL